MDFVKMKRIRSVARKYISNFNSRPSGANKSKVLEQLDMLEEEILEEKERLEDSPLDIEDVNNIIKQKSKLESILQSFSPIDIKKEQKENFQQALDGFFYECKVAELKFRGVDVDPSKFRERRGKEEKKEEEGESEEVIPEGLELQKATEV